jgi:hypothetical protein
MITTNLIWPNYDPAPVVGRTWFVATVNGGFTSG